VTRRLHVPQLHVGIVELPADQTHHARDVLRIDERATVELFDDAGQIAHGQLSFNGHEHATVAVSEVLPPTDSFHLTIASAVPKGERADWMIEKLSELGVSHFIPLATQRSVVLPGGTNKRQRWERLAVESAKQSHRQGVMQIGDLTPLATAMTSGWYLSPEPRALPIIQSLAELKTPSLRLFIGPEGGWTDAERAAFGTAGLTPVRLTDTILRIETAAVAAAAVVMCAVRSSGQVLR
jgi:16S rRNA (uracil1498-N3)-methyltransferase